MIDALRMAGNIDPGNDEVNCVLAARSHERCRPNNRYSFLREKSMKLLPMIALSAAIIGAGAGCVRTPPTTTAPTPIATNPAAKLTRGQKAAVSKACSEQADARNLHGKERKTSAPNACEAAAKYPQK